MWLRIYIYIFHTFETLAFQRPPRSGQPQSCGRPPVTSSLSREELWFSSASSRGSKWSIGYQMMQPELSCWSPLCYWYAIIINLQWSFHCEQPQYFLPLHSIHTVGNLTGKILFSWIFMRQGRPIFFQWNHILQSNTRQFQWCHKAYLMQHCGVM